MKNYEKLRKEAWDFYTKLEPVHCPVLNNEVVVFSRAGFDHLTQKNRTPRPQKDQLRRFRLLHYATNLLKDPTSKVIYQEGRNATFWRLTNRVRNKTIKVIVRQKRSGQKHFFSIMN